MFLLGENRLEEPRAQQPASQGAERVGSHPYTIMETTPEAPATEEAVAPTTEVVAPMTKGEDNIEHHRFTPMVQLAEKTCPMCKTSFHGEYCENCHPENPVQKFSM